MCVRVVSVQRSNIVLLDIYIYYNCNVNTSSGCVNSHIIVHADTQLIIFTITHTSVKILRFVVKLCGVYVYIESGILLRHILA